MVLSTGGFARNQFFLAVMKCHKSECRLRILSGEISATFENEQIGYNATNYA